MSACPDAQNSINSVSFPSTFEISDQAHFTINIRTHITTVDYLRNCRKFKMLGNRENISGVLCANSCSLLERLSYFSPCARARAKDYTRTTVRDLDMGDYSRDATDST